MDAKAVLQQLDRMLRSRHFRNSRRYPAFLAHIVRRTLKGDLDSLKERILGIEVFKRPHDYDTGADPAVRITAGEVRKRIALYYHDEGTDQELRIELPPGSYVPVFSPPGMGAAAHESQSGIWTATTELSTAMPVLVESGKEAGPRYVFRNWLLAAITVVVGVACGGRVLVLGVDLIPGRIHVEAVLQLSRPGAHRDGQSTGRTGPADGQPQPRSPLVQ